MAVQLFDHQIDAINRMHNGCILCGKVGSGKSRTAVAYYFSKECGGSLSPDYKEMENPKDLYIITTARKRDTMEWEAELTPFLISANKEINRYGEYMNVVIDSWNNIKKYVDVSNAFFIFDEQRVVGSGVWVKSFIKITKSNHWILLSATPGDTWMDYIPVFVANGYYRNRSEFITRHVIYNRYSKFPKVDKFFDERRLVRYRNQILVNMDFNKPTSAHYQTITTDYDRDLYKGLYSKRWNMFEDKPIANAAELCYLLRKVINSDPSRIEAILELVKSHPKVIIFYNYDYELTILKDIYYGDGFKVAEWNGHKHELIPISDKWVYLVQYTAGAEGWNCIETDTIIFYSLNYSYKIMVQSAGRIDRMNTPFNDLYYYKLKSSAPIDIAIARALAKKQNFNENHFVSL